MEEKKIKLRVQGLTNSQIQSGAYALVLAEDGLRRLPVIVGMFEAQSIAIALEGLNPQRPLTHDLFTEYIKATGFILREVFIHKFSDGVFYAEIVLTDTLREIRLDSRTSDAIAIALRCSCDIYTTESIMKKCSVVLEEGNYPSKSEPELLFEELTTDDLQDIPKLRQQLRTLKKKEIKERMEKAVSEENYEFAKIYKDELSRREKENKKD
ncbi:MAG: bifunctional nuclease family protein [Prevotellaceae bacterium]|jgi:bifunctional DNase/RNase|nr:bifunctional nuclease family protein [Prevotellaceae bacterium]